MIPRLDSLSITNGTVLFGVLPADDGAAAPDEINRCLLRGDAAAGIDDHVCHFRAQDISDLLV